MTKDDLKFSILISNHNNGKYLQQAIESAISQSYNNLEIVIVDDASTDSSIDILKSYYNHPKVIIHGLAVNMGQGFVKKKLIELSSGDLLGYLDSDDALTINAVEMMVDFHKRYKFASLVYSQSYICDLNLNVKWVNENTQKLTLNYLEGKPYSIFHFSTFKRESINKITLWNDEDLRAMDQDLYYKLEEVGEVVYIEKPLYFYRRHNTNLTCSQGQVQSLAWHFKYIYEACDRRGKLELFPSIVARILSEREISIVNSLSKKKIKHSLFWKILKKIK